MVLFYKANDLKPHDFTKLTPTIEIFVSILLLYRFPNIKSERKLSCIIVNMSNLKRDIYSDSVHTTGPIIASVKHFSQTNKSIAFCKLNVLLLTGSPPTK